MGGEGSGPGRFPGLMGGPTPTPWRLWKDLLWFLAKALGLQSGLEEWPEEKQPEAVHGVPLFPGRAPNDAEDGHTPRLIRPRKTA